MRTPAVPERGLCSGMFSVSTKTGAAAFSIASNAFLVVIKVIVAVLTGSISVFSEAAHSGIDLIASIFAWGSVRVSSRPPDEGHPFGHGKYESVSGSVEAVLIFVVAIFIFREAGKELMGEPGIKSTDTGLLVMAISAITNFFISRFLFRMARKTDSIALEADAQHLATDVYTSLGVFVGLALVRITGLRVLDPVAAIVVAALIVKVAYDLTAKALRELLDERLPDEEKRKIELILSEHVTDFVGFHKFRCRRSGSTRHIDLHLVVCRDRSVDKAHQLCDHLEADIESAVRFVSVTIHVEPCRLEAERCATECPERRA
ncbi:MAG: cation diffusion facilitator family transporter [Candidatus Eisenbacteria bacterium]|nr:cation diffusion facilitator family transporter [Candidatus Eisenbacteria bacterium]